jgi:hypothetical protein
MAAVLSMLRTSMVLGLVLNVTLSPVLAASVACLLRLTV